MTGSPLLIMKPKVAQPAEVKLKYEDIAKKFNEIFTEIENIIEGKKKYGYEGKAKAGPYDIEFTSENAISKTSPTAEKLFDFLKSIGFNIEKKNKEVVAISYEKERIAIGDELSIDTLKEIGNIINNKLRPAGSIESAVEGAFPLGIKLTTKAPEELGAVPRKEEITPKPAEKPVQQVAVEKETAPQAPTVTAAEEKIHDELIQGVTEVTKRIANVKRTREYNYGYENHLRSSEEEESSKKLPKKSLKKSPKKLPKKPPTELDIIPLAVEKAKLLRWQELSSKKELTKGEADEFEKLQRNLPLTAKKLRSLMPWMPATASDVEVVNEAIKMTMMLRLEKTLRLYELASTESLSKSEKKELTNLQKLLGLKQGKEESSAAYTQRVRSALMASVNATASVVLSGTPLKQQFDRYIQENKYTDALGLLENALSTVVNIGGQSTMGLWLADVKIPKELKLDVLTQVYRKINPFNLRELLLLKFKITERTIQDIIGTWSLSSIEISDKVKVAAQIEQLRLKIISGEEKKAFDKVIQLLEGNKISLIAEVEGEKINLINVAKSADQKYSNLMASSLLSIAEAQLLKCKSEENSLLDWSKKLFVFLFDPKYKNVTADKRGALVFANAAIHEKLPYHVEFQNFIYHHSDYNAPEKWGTIIANELDKPRPVSLTSGFAERSESVFFYGGELSIKKGDKVTNGTTIFYGKLDTNDPYVYTYLKLPQEIWYTIIPDSPEPLEGQNPYVYGEYPAQMSLTKELSDHRPSPYYLNEGFLNASNELNEIVDKVREMKYKKSSEKVRKGIAISGIPIHHQLYLFDLYSQIAPKEVEEVEKPLKKPPEAPPVLVEKQPPTKKETPTPLFFVPSSGLIKMSTEGKEYTETTAYIPGELSEETARKLNMDKEGAKAFKNDLENAYAAATSGENVKPAAEALYNAMPEDTKLTGEDAEHYNNAREELQKAIDAPTEEEAERHLKNALDELQEVSELQEGFLENATIEKRITEFDVDTKTLYIPNLTFGFKGEHTFKLSGKKIEELIKELLIAWELSGYGNTLPGTVTTTVERYKVKENNIMELLSTTKEVEGGKYTEKGVKESILLGLKFRKGGTLYIFIDGNTGMARLTTEEGKELSKTQITRINSIGGGMQLKIPISEKHQYITIGGMTFQTPLTIARGKTHAQLAPALFGGMGLSEKLEKATITTLLTAGNTLYLGETGKMSPFVTLRLDFTRKNFNIFGFGTYQYKSTKVGGEKKDTLTFGVGSGFKLYDPFGVGFEVDYTTIRNKSDYALSGLLPGGLRLQFYIKFITNNNE